MKLLFIATQLPPYIGSGNIRMLNYINRLHDKGYSIDVIGVDYPEDSIAYDPLSRNAFNNGIGVYRIPPGFLYKIFYRRKQVKIVSKESKKKVWDIKHKINQLIRSTILIPDSYRYWVTPAFKKAAELMERKEYDIIFTAHETPSSHMVGLKLKKSFPKVKWIGYWSDPWNGEKAFREYSLRFKRSIEEKMEQKVVKNVDRLFFTTEGTRHMYIDKYKLDAGRTDVILRGYDKAKFKNIKRKQNPPEGIKCDKINIVYTGTIYGELRSIRPLCSALEYLKYNRKDIFAILNIIFIGQFTDSKDRSKLQSFENVSIFGLIPYEEALRYIVYADCLLLYGNKDSQQVPGKLYEYAGSEAVILTIHGGEKDELKGLAERISKGPVIGNDSGEIIDALNKIFSYKKKGVWNLPFEGYEWEKVIQDLEEKIQKVL